MSVTSCLICGFGSIGRRHFRHFRDLGCSPMNVFSTGLGTMEDDPDLRPDHVFHDFQEALKGRPDVVVIANPTSLHLESTRTAIKAGCNVLIEKPLSSELDGCREISDLAAAHVVKVAVAYNQRFHPGILKIRELIRSQELGEPLMARAHVAGYLPDWHPWEDYRQGYAARSDLGGGAARTNIHELDYVLWLLGPAETHHSMEMGKHPLETDVDEGCAYLIRHANGALSSVTSNLVQRPGSRSFEVFFAEGSAVLDFVGNDLKLGAKDGTWTKLGLPEGFTVDLTYRDQAAAFLRLIDGCSTDLTTIDEAISSLEIAIAFEKRRRPNTAR